MYHEQFIWKINLRSYWIKACGYILSCVRSLSLFSCQDHEKSTNENYRHRMQLFQERGYMCLGCQNWRFRNDKGHWISNDSSLSPRCCIWSWKVWSLQDWVCSCFSLFFFFFAMSTFIPCRIRRITLNHCVLEACCLQFCISQSCWVSKDTWDFVLLESIRIFSEHDQMKLDHLP